MLLRDNHFIERTEIQIIISNFVLVKLDNNCYAVIDIKVIISRRETETKVFHLKVDVNDNRVLS